MKQKISLGGSISVLIGAVIAILALLRGPVQTVLLLVTFILWGLWVLLTLLRPAWRDNRTYRRQAELEAERQNKWQNGEKLSCCVECVTRKFIRKEFSKRLRINRANRSEIHFIDKGKPELLVGQTNLNPLL